MYTKLFRSIFNVSLEEMLDELLHQYIREEQQVENDKNTNTELNNWDHLLTAITDPKCILGWKVNDGRRSIVPPQIAKLKFQDSDSVFRRYSPKDGASDYYSLLYSVAYLYYCIGQIDEKKAIPSRSSINDDVDNTEPPSVFQMFVDEIIGYLSNCKDTKNCQMDKDKRENLNSLLIDFHSSRFSRNICTTILGNKEGKERDRKLLLLSIQLNAFSQILINPNTERESAIRHSISSLALQCAERCYQTEDNEHGIRFSVLALFTDKSEERENAFNYLALCAIENKQYQLAYDAYFSWINKKVIGSLERDYGISSYLLHKINVDLQCDMENEWRANDRHKKTIARIYGNFAYVCGVMYNLLIESDQKRQLLYLAKKNILRAIDYDKESNSYYCSAGTVFSYDGDVEKAIYYYKECMKRSKTLPDRVNALYSLLSEYKDDLSDDLLEEFESKTSEFLSAYRQLSNNEKYADSEEVVNARDLFYLLSECVNLSTEKKELEYILLEIDNEQEQILKILKRSSHITPNFDLHIELFADKDREKLMTIHSLSPVESADEQVNHSEIAYYTSLQSLRFLLSESKPENGSNMNCLTMWHARYMNDPEEGLVLLQKLQDYLPKAPIEMRNELYDQKFIFLKSFTGLIDQLNMWTAYGSNRENGKDCDGCCICIAPETFDIVSDLQKKTSVKKPIRAEDDFHLYSVAYLDGDQIIVNGKRSERLEERYTNLKRLVCKLRQALEGASSTDTSIVSNSLIRLFEKIMFLFKDKSYNLEVESRLIISRDVKDRSEIKKTDTMPKRLFINPKFQVFPERIILGPKVDNPDYWIPYLQYELSHISEKWPTDMKRAYKPTVRISGINIR